MGEFALIRGVTPTCLAATCQRCGAASEQAYEVHWVASDCEQCGRLCADGGNCPHCGAANPRQASYDAVVCYRCILAGRGGWSWNTELGEVDPLAAATGKIYGQAQGYPGGVIPSEPLGEELLLTGAAVISYLHDPVVNGPKWESKEEIFPDGLHALGPEEQRQLLMEVGLRLVRTTRPRYFIQLPAVDLQELTATPPYPCCQTPAWLFCCLRPMIYLGEWTKADFQKHCPTTSKPRKWFFKIVDDAESEFWTRDGLSQEIEVHMFQCRVCSGFRGRWDGT